MKSNPFLEFGAFPRFASIGPPQVTDAINTLIGAVQDTVTQVSADAAPPTWETVCAPVEAALEALIRAWNQVEHLHSVIGTEDWRTVYEGNLPHIATLFAQLGQHEGLHRRLCALRDSAHFAELSATRKKIILDNIDDLERSGVSLPEDKKAAFQSNSEQLSLLGATFEKNLVQATDAHSLTVEDESVLSDMPADLRDIARQSAEEANTKGWRFTLQQPSFIAFIKYGKDRKLREKMHRAYFTRASELDSDERNNRPVIEKIIDLRRQQAKLLGNKTFSALTLERRMAETPDQAIEFLRDLLRRALPHARRELAELREFAATELGIDDLQQWDAPYASEQLRQRRYHFSEAELRPYLQQERVLSGLFQCVHQLFGVRLKPATAEVWHEDVRHYQVLDREENPIGGLYLDPYAREKKRGGAWMADALSRYRRRDDTLQLPLAHVTCNFAKPAAGAALMDWSEVETLFHEFGHTLHHLLTEVDEYSVSGISGVEWDAVELPSQWLENFVWDWTITEPMTAHIDHGGPMPKSLFDKATKAKQFQSGLFLVRQLELALFDLLLHTDPDLSPAAALAQTQKETALLPVPEYSRLECGFSHIFAGGYAAGYYSYLWAEVLALDILALFKSHGGLLNPELGDRFRRQVLAVGGSRPAMDSFIAVRGRKPDIAPLLAHYGLST